jgi:hypothetical protein
VAVPEDAHKADVAALIVSFDELVKNLERIIAGLEAELGPARAGGDERYLRRVERGLEWARSLLELLDERVLPTLGDLRHNAQQLVAARDGRMV